MRILKGMMACMAALFILGYVNSCDAGSGDKVAKLEESTNPQQQVH